jgi:hypothetical protein
MTDTPTDAEPLDICVPLCAADKVYGRRAEWWRHEALCPARKARKPGHSRDRDADETHTGGD